MESIKGVTTERDLGPFQEMWDAWEESRERLLVKPLNHFCKATCIQFDELAGHLAHNDREAAAREAADIVSVSLNLMRRLGYTSVEISEIAREREESRKGARKELTATLGPFQAMWDACVETHEELNRKPLSYFRRTADDHFEELARHWRAGDQLAAARKAIDVINVALKLMRRFDHTPAQVGEIARLRAIQRMKGQTQQILDKYEKRYNI